MNSKTKKALAWGIGATIAGGIIYWGGKKYFKTLKTKKEINTYSQSTVSLPSGGTLNVIETARQLGIDLGFAYPSWDPRAWSENDTAAFNLIKKVPKTLMPKVAIEYFKLYKRNLQEDCQKVLDDYSKISYLFL
jgi:hypothetical protein